jgi:hypothetical protein
VAEIVADDHPGRNRDGHSVDEVQFVVFHFEADPVGVGDGHDSSSLALRRITACDVPQIKITLRLFRYRYRFFWFIDGYSDGSIYGLSETPIIATR